jgi:hypothetical protein
MNLYNRCESFWILMYAPALRRSPAATAARGRAPKIQEKGSMLVAYALPQ